MDIKVIENLESILPQYIITNKGMAQLIGGEITKINNDLENDIVSPDVFGDFPEGSIYEIIQELKHRDRKLRQLAIYENGGYICSICGFNFEDFYGEVGKNIIEIHHLIPLSAGERITTIDKIAVVCANCHRVLHHYGKMPMPVDELKKSIDDKRKEKTIEK